MHIRTIFLLVTTSLLWAFSTYGQSAAFIQNNGQWNDQVAYRFPLPNGDMWLEENGWSLCLLNETEREEALHVLHGEEGSSVVHGHQLKMRFIDANLSQIEGKVEQSVYHNYFLGNDKSQWQSRVPLYEEVVYSNLYQGIDLRIEKQFGQPKMTYILEPYADVDRIQIHYDGHRGMRVKDAELQIQTSIGMVREEGLYAYQLVGGQRVQVSCRFILRKNVVSFKVGKYNHELPLYIDPTVIASTNSGCTSEAFGHTATFNEAGQIYSAGRCFGAGYPTDTGAFQVDFGGPYTGSYYLKVDMCLSKYNQTGSTLLYATYIGGNAEDLPHSMIVNSNDQVVLLGSTNSTNYPVSTNAYDTTHNGSKDIVITSFTSDGTQLVGSTYLGGTASDGVNILEEYYADAYRGEVILDSSDNVYIASFSRSSNFPVTAGVFQDTNAGSQDGVVCKLTSNLDSLYWATYLGGGTRDAAFGLKLSDSGYVFVAGVTESVNFPVDSNGAYPTYLGGGTDAFVVKLNPDATQLLSGSFFGTAQGDQNYFLERDSDGGVYLFGTTAGTISASTGRYSGPGNGGYVYKTNSDLDTIEWVSSFGDLAPAAFLVDNCSRIYISGQGATATVLNLNSFDTLDAVNSQTQAGFYLMKLSPDAIDLEFGSFYGNNGSHVDGGTSRFDKRGVVYQATCSNGTFPTTSWAYSTTNQTNNATYDNTVFKIDFESNVAKAEIVPGDSACAPFLAIFDNEGSVGSVHYWDFGDGTTSTDSMPTHLYDSVGVYDIFYVITDSNGCYGNDTNFLTLDILPSVIPEIIIGDTDCVDSVLLSVDTTEFQDFLWSSGQTGSEIYVFAEGSYMVTTTANLFCVQADTVGVTFQEAYNFNLNDTGICELNFPVIGPSSAITYLWSTGDTTQSTLIPETGTYTLTASNGECEQTESMNVEVSYVNFDQNDTIVCKDSLKLVAQQPGGNVLWSTNQTSAGISVWQSGQYWVTVSNGFCVSSDTINVIFNPQLINLGDDTVACGPFNLAVTGDFDYYNWNTGDDGPSILVDSAMTIWLKVGQGECSDVDSIRVRIQDLRFDVDGLTVCDADSGRLYAPKFSNADYYWSTGDTSISTWAFSSGSYWVDIRTEYCRNLDSLAVRFVNTPPFSLGPDTSFCVGETLNIPIDNNYSTPIWSTGDTGSALVLTEPGEVWAAQEYDGCLRYDSINVALRKLFSDSFSLINNVMTPNGDGMNDELKFFIQEESLVLDYHLWVYDRWGVKVFESEEWNTAWDGNRPSGKQTRDGTFFYILEVETTCHQRPFIRVMDNVTVFH